MTKLPLLFLLFTSVAQGALIKASMQILISDHSRSEPIGELGAGHLFFDTENSILLYFQAETEHYAFSMHGEPLMINWDIHGLDGGTLWNYGYGAFGGGTLATRLNGTEPPASPFAFELFGEGLSALPEDGFDVIFRNGDGFMNIWEWGTGSAFAAPYRIALDMANCALTVVDAVPVPESSGLFLLLSGLVGSHVAKRKRLLHR